MKKAALHSLGCKVNSYETEAMQQMLEQAGYEIVPFHDRADVYIINTCSVTNIADRKSRQMIHKAKKMNPGAIVVAAGCYVQTSTEQAKADAAIDIIIGNNKKQDLLNMLAAYEADHGAEQEGVLDINHTKQEYEELTVIHPSEHTRAFLKVQDGCNQFCSYCIIPYARGRVRSRKLEDVEREARRLAENGFQELVLTGIHSSGFPGAGNNYGKLCTGSGKTPKGMSAFSFVIAERKCYCIKTDEPSVYTGRISGKMRIAASVL